jgi:hypothetical protein
MLWMAHEGKMRVEYQTEESNHKKEKGKWVNGEKEMVKPLILSPFSTPLTRSLSSLPLSCSASRDGKA